MFVFPWEGATVVGTTDLDHREDLDLRASITREELDYLLEACAQPFPQAEVTAADVLCTWSGVRPVVGAADSQAKPSMKPASMCCGRNPLCDLAGAS
ncbi:FAD-dependent oxidoreductase [Pseudomonas hygromyciniae]|uniref:FAD-dependent oxidoreductase n=1 Tax=Pseudomonas hygromyciniae TaxID=2812000 RepID=UPI0023DDD355